MVILLLLIVLLIFAGGYWLLPLLAGAIFVSAATIGVIALMLSLLLSGVLVLAMLIGASIFILFGITAVAGGLMLAFFFPPLLLPIGALIVCMTILFALKHRQAKV
jgi:hypothetical protein